MMVRVTGRLTEVEACGETRYATVLIHPNMSPSVHPPSKISTLSNLPLDQGRCLPLCESPALISHLTRLPRFLTENADVWSQNAWDHVPPPVDQDATIAASLTRQRAAPVPDDHKPEYNTKPAASLDPYSNLFESIGTIFTRQTPQTSSRIASG